MIIDNINVMDRTVTPDEADAPLVVDPNAVLAFPIAFEGFEPIAPAVAAKRSGRSRRQHGQLSLCRSHQIRWKSFRHLAIPNSLGILGLDVVDHDESCCRGLICITT
jgi:hypothetical protein